MVKPASLPHSSSETLIPGWTNTFGLATLFGKREWEGGVNSLILIVLFPCFFISWSPFFGPIQVESFRFQCLTKDLILSPSNMLSSDSPLMRRRSRSVGNFLSSQGYGSVSFKDLGTEPTASMRDPFSGMNPRQVEGSRDGARPLKNSLPTQKREFGQFRRLPHREKTSLTDSYLLLPIRGDG